MTKRKGTGKTSKTPQTAAIAALFHQALARHQQGELQAAAQAYRRILELQPGHADSTHLLGVIHLQRGELAEAERWIRAALAINPGAAPYWNNLGETLRKQQRLEEARVCLARAIELAPRYGDAHNNLGNVCSEEGDQDAAARCYEQALAFAPEQARTWYNLGSSYRRLKQFEKGIAAFKRAITLDPRYADAYNNLGLIHSDLHDEGAAEAAFRQALASDPEHADAKANLGYVLMLRNDLDAALPMLSQSFEKRSNNELLRLTLAMVHATIGEVEPAAALLAALEPTRLQPEAHANALFFWNYDPGLTTEQLVAHYRRWGALHASRANELPAFGPRVAGTRIRVGYVSADFNNHAVKNFLLPLLQQHDRQQFQVFAYSNSTTRDESTKAFEQAVEVWRDIARLPDKEAALLVRKDEIDLLVDLSGHTRGGRLAMFSYRAAPVQVSWLGYGCTTGVAAVDYFIGDDKLTPPGCEKAFTETLVRLDRPSLVYRPSAALPVGELPCLRKGTITFGSLSRVIRINSEVLAVWARILGRVENSTLLLNQPVFDNQVAREAVWRKFEAHGIARERAILQNRAPHWLSYAEDIDIALDPFPHNAGTTTFEALWMGVPVVSIRSRPSMGRYGDMILSAINRAAWVADTEEDYIDIAVALAGDKNELAAIRGTLRKELQDSPLMDEAGFCRSMERLYRHLHAVRREDERCQAIPETQAASLPATLSPEHYVDQLEKMLLVRQSAAAERLARQFIQHSPDDARAYMGLGLALRQQDRSEEGIAAYEKAVQLDPDLLPARLNLGRGLTQTGKLHEAVAVLREAARLQPKSAAVQSLLSWALRFIDAHDEAIAAARAAIALDGKHLDAWQNLGNALRAAGKTTEAANAYRRVIELDPNNLDARTCLGSVLKDRALYPEAREVYEEGLRRSATADDAIWTNYFFSLNYDPYLSAEAIAERYREWGMRTEARIQAISSPQMINKDPARKLRVGLVSADFFRHAIRFFVHPWLDAADRENFHWTLYSNTTKEDAETERFKQKAECWRDIRWKPDQEVLEMIRRDEIDILIDLSGHTAGNKLFVFAAKAAPLQMAMLGTGYTTGLSTMDYFLAAPSFVPAAASGLFTERIIRLPIPPFVFQPEYPALTVAEAPARRNGYVTFGCMSRMVRLNRLVISAWIGILRRLPDARLRLDHPQVIDAETRALLEQQFEEGGIDLARVDLLSTKPHWAAYDEIDIALDPFPHNAGTTTIEALWKGVPVLTLAGRPPLGRFGDTILHAVGLGDWVATDVDSYIDKAVEQSSDVEKLALLRSHLRQRVQFSPLMDGQGFALHLQSALRMAWQRYCSDAPAADFDIQPIERDAAWVNARLAAGTIHLKKHELESARFLFKHILKFNPYEPRAWLNLGACLRYGGQDQEGLACFEKAVEVDPAYIAGWYNLGVTQQAFRRFDDAEKAYLRALSLDAKHHEAWNNLGVIYKEAQRGNEALKCFRSALALCPDKPSYLDNLGSLMERGDRLFEAKRLLEHCLELEPGYLSANANLGIVFRKLALIDEAMMIQRRVPDTTLINHPLLFTANYHPDLPAQELYALYETTCRKVNELPRLASAKPQKKAKLRVGFVGGDFRAHAVSKFLLPLFQHFHSEKMEFVIFANQAKFDSVSEKFRQCAQWVGVYEMNDADFIDCVQQEAIDVLIDVAGWTNGSRLAAMAQKPAPVQVSWLGYGYTTGLRSIDWFLGAPRFTPPGCELFFSEKIVNLPCVPFCFDGIGDAPEVNALPALSENGVTFGCLSRTVRLNHRVIRVWAEILLQIPLSRLILDSKPFEDAEVCAHFHALFLQHGVNPERVILRNSIPHWRAYHDIDISLDPFPHNAGTTTIESLAMGVPSISLRDRPPLGRFGDVILGAVGLDDWVVDTEREYVDCARRMAGELQALADLRKSLRARLLSSALCDYPRFARDFETAIADIWERATSHPPLVRSGAAEMQLHEQ
jgi:predicted O-linked N-acetylglucosamine transferase (SPINDLY family)